MWLRVASHLRMPLSLCKRSVSSSEFVLWKVYLGKVQFDPLHAYLAQVACEIRRTSTKRPNSVKLKDFILDFDKKSKQIDVRADKETGWRRSKRAVLAAFGIRYKE